MAWKINIKIGKRCQGVAQGQGMCKALVQYPAPNKNLKIKISQQQLGRKINSGEGSCYENLKMADRRNQSPHFQSHTAWEAPGALHCLMLWAWDTFWKLTEMWSRNSGKDGKVG